MWGSGFGSPPEQHGVQGRGSVAGAGLSWSQGTGPPPPHQCPTSEVKEGPDTALGAWPPWRLFPDCTPLLSGHLGPGGCGQTSW